MDHIDGMLREQGIDYYRQDFNMDPLPNWRANDPPNRRGMTEIKRRSVAPFMLGDYYPLTPYSIQLNEWIAWQFDRPDLKGGVIQAFRRDKTTEPIQLLRLTGLAPAAKYEITDHDGGVPRTMSGKELMEKGLRVEIRTQPGSAVIFYNRR